MHFRRLLIENLEGRRVLAAAGAEAVEWESVIVSLNDNVTNPRGVGQGVVNAHGGQLGHIYEHSIRGFSAQLPAAAINALSKNPNVKLIEPDLAMQAFEQVLPTGIRRIDANHNLVSKINGIDERVNVNIAIIDSGIDMYHPDLNVVGGKRFYTVNSGPPRNRGTFADDNYNDDYGHGTHVAGTAAALDNDFGVVGVAPGARLWGVKVLDANGSGYTSDIIAGINWVTSTRSDSNPDNDIEIANMSLGGLGASTAYHNAIKASVNAGVVYVVAAGNEYRDILGSDFQFGTADDTIPAAYPEVATISAMADSNGLPGGGGSYVGGYADDTFADFSNFSNSDINNNSYYQNNNKVNNPEGLGIDLVLPGVGIYSTYKNGGYALNSGTSMAAPHATGLAALYIAQHGRANNAQEVYDIRQALINGAKAWRSPEGLVVPATGGNSDSPDKHEERFGWAGPTTPDSAHDVAITSLVASPTTAVLGTPITLTVELANQGTFDELFLVDVSIAGSSNSPTSQSVSLAAGAATTIVFNWTAETTGSFAITASIQAVAEEIDVDDNSAATTVEIIAPVHDIAVTSFSVAPTVIRGELLTFSVVVTNQGTYTENVTVSVTESPGNSNFPPQTIQGLVAGGSLTLVFSWSTDLNTSLGEHELTVVAAPVAGETNTADNSLVRAVTVLGTPPQPTTIDDGEAGYSTTGSGWGTKSSNVAYAGDYDSVSGGNGSATAAWNFGTLAAGQYEVYATWVSHPKKQATNAPYSVLGTTVLVDQQKSPDGNQITGWQRLRTVNLDGSTNLTVRLTNNANGIVVADAIRIVSVPSGAGAAQAWALAPLDQQSPPVKASRLIVLVPMELGDAHVASPHDAVFAQLAVSNSVNPWFREAALQRSSRDRLANIHDQPLQTELLANGFGHDWEQ